MGVMGILWPHVDVKQFAQMALSTEGARPAKPCQETTGNWKTLVPVELSRETWIHLEPEGLKPDGRGFKDDSYLNTSYSNCRCPVSQMAPSQSLGSGHLSQSC